ncbi:quinone oxidoreductase-like [Acanthaster planci]|uniref:Quinone oxidoreductase-like n=1 Tax=Acanthaster planci TaxID=133434 RepID=A0A8B7YRD1_ACAPL|nr:quinone oxidoreductase-like [Acanthaster planci]XP_022095247.1 quinone oxidoreductase-like [Acanthaster planci]XP_022095248.1 quinone oxidoreductase-like [Acanthaster planci]
MNAVVIEKYGGPEVLQFSSDVEVPTPDANQVLVRMKAAGINSADSRIREGNYLQKMFKPGEILGVDGAGIVETVGDGVTNFKPGDRVYLLLGKTGTYAQYVLANENNVYLLHDKLSFKEGAVMAVPYFTAYRALVQRAKLEKGETVLIQGASGQVGLACLQIARWLGAGYIVGTAGTPEGRNLALKMRADAAIDYRAEDFQDKLKEAFSDKDIDVIIEMNSDINLELDIEVIGHGGRIVVVGKRGETTCNPGKLITTEASVMGSGLKQSTESQRIAIATALYEAAGEGWVRPHVNKEYTLDEAEKAHTEMESRRGGVGKSIFIL